MRLRDSAGLRAVRSAGFSPLIAVALLCAAIGGGCAAGTSSRFALPAAHSTDRGLLVIHSDFPLPAEHRLVEELAARRRDLSRQLGLPMSGEPIHVYLFEDARRFEDYIRLYHPGFPPRRAYFLETDARLEVFAQWGDHVAEDLRHEVTHGYLHAVVPSIPLWLDEGLAEYAEVPRGRQGLNRPHVERLLTAWQRGEWRPDLARLESFDPARDDMTQTDYAESWAWTHLLLQSQPELHRELCDYLAGLIRDGAAEPLSARLARTLGRPDDRLVEHLASLSAPRPQ